MKKQSTILYRNRIRLSKFSLLLLFFGSINELRAINNIRWGSTGDPLKGVTITWSNAGTGDSIRWGNTTTLEKGHFQGVKRTGYSGSFYKYTFPELIPKSNLYYQLYDSKTSTWGTTQIFKTAPAGNTKDFSFLAMGDSRDGLSTWNKIAILARNKNTDFTLFNGDIVADGGNAGQWDNWFSQGAPLLQSNLVFHSLGNHDAKSVPTYQNIFELPKSSTNTNLYYSFTYGDAVFICLNSEKPGDAAQAQWLVETLKSNKDKTWKVVFFHRPFFTIGNHAGEMNSYVSTWWKAFDDYGVDLICNGHDHMYERTKPINRSVNTSSPVSTYGSLPGQGRCQIVCGGAGAPLYSGSASWFIEKFKSNYNFCKFNIKGNILTDTTFDSNGAIIETFSIVKAPSGGGTTPIDTTHTGGGTTPVDTTHTGGGTTPVDTTHTGGGVTPVDTSHSGGGINPVDTTTHSNGGSNTTGVNGVAENANQKFNPILISPNPAEGIFLLSYSSAYIGDAYVKICDINGKEFITEKVQKTGPELKYIYDLNGFAKGVYFVKVSTGNQVDNALLIIK